MRRDLQISDGNLLILATGRTSQIKKNPDFVKSDTVKLDFVI